MSMDNFNWDVLLQHIQEETQLEVGEPRQPALVDYLDLIALNIAALDFAVEKADSQFFLEGLRVLIGSRWGVGDDLDMTEVAKNVRLLYMAMKGAVTTYRHQLHHAQGQSFLTCELEPPCPFH